MSQALHIFRKDLRSLRWEICAVLALMTAYTLRLSGIHSLSYLEWLLPPAWIYLVVRAMLEEPLPGDRQFWITRPYHRGSLVCAKTLFVVALVNLPLLISDCVILATHGFSPVYYFPGLLWRQAALTIVVLLPAAALAAVTRNIGQVLIVIFGVAAAIAAADYYLSSRQQDWGPMQWTRYITVIALWFAAALAVLLWQYASRKTAVSRAIVVAAVVLTPALFAAVPWSAAFAVHARMLPQSASVPLAIQYDSTRGIQVAPPGQTRSGITRASVPITISGLGRNQDFQTDAISIELESQGEKWRYNWSDAMFLSRGPGGNYWADIYISGPWRAARRRNVNLRLAVALTVFDLNEPVTAQPDGSRLRVANFGVCTFDSSPSVYKSIECVSPLRSPPRTVTSLRPLIHLTSYAPYPADFRVAPIVATGFERRIPWADRVRFITERPVAHVIRELDIPGVSLE